MNSQQNQKANMVANYIHSDMQMKASEVFTFHADCAIKALNITGPISYEAVIDHLMGIESYSQK